MINKKQTLKKLQTIPGVGKEISEDFYSLGIRAIDDLKNKDPQKLYDLLCKKQHAQIDRCMLYVFRCAVYFASTKKHNKKLLNWWNWSNKNLKFSQKHKAPKGHA